MQYYNKLMLIKSEDSEHNINTNIEFWLGQ